MCEDPEKHFLIDRLSNLSSTFFNELNQTFPFSFDIINQILNSKLLLVDHVELIEEALADLEVKLPNSKFLTFTNLSALSASTLLLGHVWPSSGVLNSILTGAVAAYGTLYSYKTVFSLRNKFLKRRFQKLLKTINKFTMGIKRNINYFNEVQFMQPKSSDISESMENNEHAWNCIKSIKTVIIELFHLTRMLETDYPLSGKILDYYCPMEDLQDCDYFTKPVTDFIPKKIKDFYNILAYITSQFLLRLALTATNESAIKAIQSKITKLIDIVQMEENCLKMKSRTKEISTGDPIKFDEAPVRPTNLGLTTLLTETSLRFNSCIAAVTDECQKLDETFNIIADDDQTFSLQHTSMSNNKDKLIEIAAHMRNIETSLSNCSDDFHRLMLIYNKLLNTLLKVDIGFMSNSEKVNDQNDGIENDSVNLLESIDEPIDHCGADDFYAYMFDENVNIKTKANNNLSTVDGELSNFEMKISRKKFKPVLSQLKEKINPIKENMLQKERVVLKAKGIDVDKLFDEEIDKRTTRYSSDEESIGSADSVEVKPRKPKRDYYEEDRNFLAQKQALNIFKMQLPTPIAGEEDILE